MPISTDSYYDIIKDGVTLDRIGLSKTLNNYTIAEIADYAFVGSFSQCGKQIMPKSQSGWTYVGYSQDHGSCPFSASFHSGTYDKIDIEDGLTEDYNLTENGIYRKVVLLHDTTGTYPFNLTTSSLANMKIITEFDAPKYTMDFGSKSDMLTTESGSHYWRPYEQTSKYNTHLGYNDNEQINTCGFQAYIVIEYNSTYYIIMANIINKIFSGELFRASNINNSNIAECANQIVDYQNANPVGIAETVTQWFSNYDFTSDNPTPIVQNLFADAEYWNDYGGYCSVILFHDKGFRQLFNFTEEYNLLLFIAGCYGIHFIVDGTVYKPIISDNFVTGYTTDLTKQSDLDNYTGSTRHTMPITPPAPTPPMPESHDNEIDVDMSQFAPSVGFVNYIEMDYETAKHVATAFNEYNASIWNIGGDLFKNLISYKIFAVYGTHSGKIKNIHIAGHELEYNDAPINGNYIDDMGVVDLGTINVGSTFRFNDWRDFAPYTKIECFVPCCGWCQLPPWVMGRTVTGTMYIDIANGSCKAVIKAGKTPVAEIGGCVAVDVPFSSVATGAKAAGLITAITNGAVSAFNPTPQNLISGSFGILSALNANYTETKGVMGDGSNINGCTQFLIKVTRPASTDTTNGTITNTYKHTKGIPTNKTITLAKGDGFTQITDANITGNMTAREKQMIVDGFRHGLIL